MSFYGGTPKRARPAAGEIGSTPFRSQSSNRFRSSLVPMSRQAASPGPKRPAAGAQQSSGKLTGFSTTQRDLFRTTSTPKAQPFAPELSPATHAKNAEARKIAPQRSVLNGMNTTGAKDLFPMRIPSPDPELSGEALAKQVPEDSGNIGGSVYADQYLADKCPSHFDDLQRRQFFCILDLRRLKYASDEIFLKKDWKLNILNFAKEYEKSRSIILLRYGLYEFKNVKPNPDTMRKWRAANGLPELPVDASDNVTQSSSPKRVGASGNKRKADDDLTSKNSAQSTGANKRRNFTSESTDEFPSSKRRVVDDDEQRSTPSAATSAFAKILDKTQSPAKKPSSTEQSASAIFASQIPNKESAASSANSNPFKPTSNGNVFAASATSIFSNPAKGASDGSILSGHKVGTVPTNTSGIFSYLSESSNNSGNEVDDDEGDEPEEDEEDGSEPESQNERESQELAPSYNASVAASAGTNTPPTQTKGSLFAPSTTSSTPNIFGTSTPNGVEPKGGLFGRVKLGSDGQPVRLTPGPEDKENVAGGNKSETSAKPTAGNFTFDATKAAISFGSSASKPATSESETTPAETPKFNTTPSAAPGSLFGAPINAKPAAPVLFGAPSNPPEMKALSAAPAPSIFSASKSVSPAPGPATLFGKAPQPADSAAAKEDSASSIFSGFGAKNNTPAAVAPLFGGAQSKKRGADGEDEPSAKRQAPGKAASTSIFGNSTSSFGAASATSASQPANSIFGTAAKPASTDIFAKSGSPSVSFQPPAADKAKPLFAASSSEAPKPAAAPLFGASSADSSKTFQFGSSQPAPTKPTQAPVASIFANAAPASSGGFNFGAPAPKPATENKPATPSFNFGGAKPAEAAAPPSFSFGGSTNASPAVSFGATPSGAGAQSFDFNFGGGGSGPGAASTTFSFGAGGGGGGAAAGGSSFTFSAGGNNGTSISNPFAQANGSGNSTSMFGSAPTNASTTPAPKPTTSFSFGAGSQTTAPGSSMFGGSQLNGGSTVNGGPSFSFTQATPQKETKPMGFFGGLGLPGADGSARGGSPMPAPSSVGTTPVNGTPEPQTQNEDGDAEAPQEQVSLTEGGPGEEDEIVVHELRARALKYIPVDKDADEEDKKKSPWTTQGLGKLRVLKNKTTGSVRLLMRAEPRGHIAINKALLADVPYTANAKTLNFMTASDNGSGLETWLLQVKTPEMAQELAAVLEANKSANKK